MTSQAVMHLQGPAAALGKPAARKAVEVGEGDFFWELNANQPFPKVAADVDAQLSKYKEVRLWDWNARGCFVPADVKAMRC